MLLGIVYITLIFIDPTEPCLPNYVPDTDESEENIVEIQLENVNNNCECGVKGSTGSKSPVTDSDLAYPQKYPWHVLIQMNSPVPKFCQGSIINELFVITSVSCLVNLENLTIRGNLLKSTQFDVEAIKLYIISKNNETLNNTKQLTAISIHCHPRALPTYVTTGKLVYDICMIQLSQKLSFEKSSSKNSITPVCLPQDSGIDFVGRKAIILGLKPGTSATSDSVKLVEEKSSWIYSNPACGIDNKRLLCTQYGKTKDIFQFENSGSPVMTVLNSGNFMQIGISSWKHLVSSSGFDSVPVDFSTNLGSYELISFINEHSERAKARWCEKPNLDFPENPKGFTDKPLKSSGSQWDGFPSTYRRTLKSCQCGIRKSLMNPRIVGGHETAVHEYGWQVQLMIQKTPSSHEGCGGSIINSKIILTANTFKQSHCVIKAVNHDKMESVKPSDIEMKIRKHSGFFKADYNDSSKVVVVAKIFSHPQFYFNYTGIGNDIAILELKEHLDFESLKYVSPICIPTIEDDKGWAGKFATIIGYGLTDPKKSGSLARKLQELDVPIHEHKKCADAANLISYSVPEKVICAGYMSYHNYKDPSHGDSGGPLMISITDETSSDPNLLHMVQIGIVSAGTYDIINKPRDKTNITALWYSSVPGYLSYIDFLSYRADAIWCSW